MSDTLFDKPQNFSEQDVPESAFISIDSNGEDNTNGLRRHKSESSIIRRRQNLSSITSSLSEKDVEETKICNNYRVSIWIKGHIHVWLCITQIKNETWNLFKKKLNIIYIFVCT